MASFFLSYRSGGFGHQRYNNWNNNRVGGFAFFNFNGNGNSSSYHRHNNDDRQFDESRFPEEGRDHTHNEYEHLQFMVDRCQSRTTHHTFADNFPKVHTRDTIDAIQVAFESTLGRPDRMADFKRTWVSFNRYPIGPQRDAEIAAAMDRLTVKFGGSVEDKVSSPQQDQSTGSEVSINTSNGGKTATVTVNGNQSSVKYNGNSIDVTSILDGNNSSITVSDKARRDLKELANKEVKDGNATLTREGSERASVTFTPEGRRQLQGLVDREIREGEIIVKENQTSQEPAVSDKRGARTDMMAQVKKLFDGDVDGQNDKAALQKIVRDMQANGLSDKDAEELNDKITSEVYGKQVSVQVAEDVLTFERTGDLKALQTLRDSLSQDLGNDPRSSEVSAERLQKVQKAFGLSN